MPEAKNEPSKIEETYGKRYHRILHILEMAYCDYYFLDALKNYMDSHELGGKYIPVAVQHYYDLCCEDIVLALEKLYFEKDGRNTLKSFYNDYECFAKVGIDDIIIPIPSENFEKALKTLRDKRYSHLDKIAITCSIKTNDILPVLNALRDGFELVYNRDVDPEKVFPITDNDLKAFKQSMENTVASLWT